MWVPQVRFVEKTVGVPQVQVQEVVRHMNKVEIQEIVKQVPKIEVEVVEKVVMVVVPQAQYVESWWRSSRTGPCPRSRSWSSRCRASRCSMRRGLSRYRRFRPWNGSRRYHRLVLEPGRC